MGCELAIKIGGDITVTGNVCKIGEKYAREEVTNPTRNIATSVRVEGGDFAMLSVKPNVPVPKGKIMDCVREVRKISVKAPVHIGDVILSNAAGTGIDFIATRNVT
jgi:CxxC motif-containing protein